MSSTGDYSFGKVLLLAPPVLFKNTYLSLSLFSLRHIWKKRNVKWLVKNCNEWKFLFMLYILLYINLCKVCMLCLEKMLHKKAPIGYPWYKHERKIEEKKLWRWRSDLHFVVNTHICTCCKILFSSIFNYMTTLIN